MSESTSSSSNTVSETARDTANRVASSAVEYGQGAAKHFVQEPAKDLVSLAKEYAKDHPDVAALWAFAIGAVIGWKIKP